MNEIIQRYKKVLQKRIDTWSGSGYDSNQHLNFMLETIEKEYKNNYPKYCRWLGYVQGTLISEKLLNVDEERNFTRPILTKLDKEFIEK